MIRTVISLDEADKRWLDREAEQQHVSMTEVVRQAVQALRASREEHRTEFDAMLADTAGIWREGDGLRWQEQQRDEWSR